jgi:hypothetical protein
VPGCIGAGENSLHIVYHVYAQAKRKERHPTGNSIDVYILLLRHNATLYFTFLNILIVVAEIMLNYVAVPTKGAGAPVPLLRLNK